jgi:hypothetical protein
MNHEIHPHTQRNNLNTALCYVTLECLTPQPPAYPEHAVAKDGVKSSRLAGACSGGSAWEARIANAGLISPLVRDVAGTVKWADVKGFPLGMDKAFEYKELEYRLTPGSALILSSDGIVEAKNMAGEMYGFDRLARCIEAEPGDRRDAQALLEWILEDVRAFEGEAERHDDLTVVVVTVG